MGLVLLAAKRDAKPDALASGGTHRVYVASPPEKIHNMIGFVHTTTGTHANRH